jgi:hypothetical protein
MTAQTTPRRRNLERYRTLRDQIETARREATEDYIERGVAAYAERGALRGDLCLLVTLAELAGERTPITLAEVAGLDELLERDGNVVRLTPAGAEAAAVAAIAHGMAHVLVRHNRAR